MYKLKLNSLQYLIGGIIWRQYIANRINNKMCFYSSNKKKILQNIKILGTCWNTNSIHLRLHESSNTEKTKPFAIIEMCINRLSDLVLQNFSQLGFYACWTLMTLVWKGEHRWYKTVLLQLPPRQTNTSVTKTSAVHTSQ